jgi:hypothetical protein
MSVFALQQTKPPYRRPQLLLSIKDNIEEVNSIFGLLEYRIPSRFLEKQGFMLNHGPYFPLWEQILIPSNSYSGASKTITSLKSGQPIFFLFKNRHKYTILLYLCSGYLIINIL